MSTQIQNIDDTEQRLEGRALTFLIEDQYYAIEIIHVIEIIEMQVITVVPQIPSYMRGIINLRGKIIPVMDVRIRFGKPEKEYNDRTSIIVIEIKGVSIGLIVDMVDEVLQIEEHNLAATPKFNNINTNKFIRALGKVHDEVKLLIDCDKLLDDVSGLYQTQPIEDFEV
ncbi:MAG: chemotaxis protein CheW [Oscillospiraceae bacterium]